MSKTKFPLVVKRGNVRVKIYATPSHGHDSFTVAYYHGGRRQRRTFADLALARQEWNWWPTAVRRANWMCWR